jgi:hypothetical protein
MEATSWTQEFADKLQAAVDSIFSQDADCELRACDFSLTIADPMLKGIPLVGCSTGFTKMTGYAMEEIIGFNCRFLVDPVPTHYLDQSTRSKARDFCNAVAASSKAAAMKQDCLLYDEDKLFCQERSNTGEGIYCAQVNMRKDGTLFNNMFYLKEVMLNEKSFIIGLQTELPWSEANGDCNDDGIRRRACRQLDRNMAAIERLLAKMFWYTSQLRRQDIYDDADGFTEEPFTDSDADVDSDADTS